MQFQDPTTLAALKALFKLTGLPTMDDLKSFLSCRRQLVSWIQAWKVKHTSAIMKKVIELDDAAADAEDAGRQEDAEEATKKADEEMKKADEIATAGGAAEAAAAPFQPAMPMGRPAPADNR
jgi:hypothetical protein